MEDKKISEMTEKEILRQQIEILAERSKICSEDELSELTRVMCQIYKLIRGTEVEVSSYYIGSEKGTQY